MQKPDLRDIKTLTKDEFNRILSTAGGSLPDGSKVALGFSSDVFACCRVQGDQISVHGSDKFEQTIKSAFASAKPTMWFGSAEKERPKVERPIPQLQPKTDTKSATTYKVPVLIYKSPREREKKIDGSKADDMVYGDMTAQQIKSMPFLLGKLGDDLNIKDLETMSPQPLLHTFREMATFWFSDDSLKMNTLAMIQHFEKGKGTDYRNSVLTKEIRSSPQTQAFSKTIIDEVIAQNKQLKGEINQLDLSKLMDGYKARQQGFRLPIFNDYITDVPRGTTIAVNDVWAGKAEITKYEKFGNFFKGTIRITFFDHFGLDGPDIGPDPTTGHIKPYGLLPGFRAWFILQHYDRFAFRPFVTVMEMDYPFSGEIQ
ncbi:TPA: DUF3289 family protein [Aeromonas hydrophila]|uniref:DUF3289 family protein n=1 Tax=Aeromonas hydrophila TaxID=644 RepID=A0AAD3UCL4_AERHY|nr:DUF3289 family protein [Aeromonas hydrophila]